MADTYHLNCRGGVWYYRRRVPQHIVHVFGRKFIQISLDTRSKAEAKKLRSLEDLKWDAQFAAAEQGELQTGNLLTDNQDGTSSLAEHVRRYVERMDRRLRHAFDAEPPAELEDLLDRQEDAELALGILRDPQDPRQDEWISQVWDRIEAETGMSISTEWGPWISTQKGV